MLIICEDCAKRYNINDSRIKGNRARFTCKECGHIIIVEKADTARRLISESTAAGKISDEADHPDPVRETESATRPDGSAVNIEKPSSKGETVLARLGPALSSVLLALLTAFICTSGVLLYLYISYLSGVLSGTGSETGFLVKALLLLSLAWTASLAVSFFVARFLAKSGRGS